MDTSLISLNELVTAEKLPPLSMTRRGFFEKFFDPQSGIYPYSMNLIIAAPFRGTGTPMKFVFAGSGLDVQEAKQFETWKLLSSVFPLFDQGTVTKCYHFLCFRDKSDKRKNYYPILLVEEVERKQAKYYSARMASLSDENPSGYLSHCEEKNAKWLAEIGL
jgi:hypothetical protein